MFVRTITASVLVLIGTYVAALLGVWFFGGDETSDEYACSKLVFSKYVAIGYCIGTLVFFNRMFPLWTPVIDQLPAITHVPAGALITATSVTLATSGGLYLIDRVYQPSIAQFYTFEAAGHERIRRQKRQLLLATAFGVALLVELTTSELVTDRPFWLLPGGLALLIGYWHLRRRIDPGGWERVRAPTADERALLDRYTDRVGRNHGRTYVFSPSERLLGDVYADSLTATTVPGEERPVIWIEASVLETFSEDELVVGLTQADELARRNGRLYTAVIHLLLSVGVVIVGWLLVEHQSLPLAVGLAVLTLVGTVVCYNRLRTCTFAADDATAELLGADTVLAGYEGQGATLEKSVLVPIDERIDRLEDRVTDADESEANEPERTDDEGSIDGAVPE